MIVTIIFWSVAIFVVVVTLMIVLHVHEWTESKSKVKFDRFLEKGATGILVYRKCNKCHAEEAFILEVDGKTHVDIDYAKHYFNLPKG